MKLLKVSFFIFYFKNFFLHILKAKVLTEYFCHCSLWNSHSYHYNLTNHIVHSQHSCFEGGFHTFSLSRCQYWCFYFFHSNDSHCFTWDYISFDKKYLTPSTLSILTIYCGFYCAFGWTIRGSTSLFTNTGHYGCSSFADPHTFWVLYDFGDES